MALDIARRELNQATKHEKAARDLECAESVREHFVNDKNTDDDGDGGGGSSWKRLLTPALKTAYNHYVKPYLASEDEAATKKPQLIIALELRFDELFAQDPTWRPESQSDSEDEEDVDIDSEDEDE